MSAIKKRRRKRRIALIISALIYSLVLVFISVIVVMGINMFFSGIANANPSNVNSEKINVGDDNENESPDSEVYVYIDKPDWEEQLLTPNEYSRPQTPIEEVTGIVVHYVGNPGTTAKQNREYFESLAVTGATSASSHFIVGLEGEIIQCIPLDEVAYASRHRNMDTISIEVCHSDKTGKFSDVTYKATIELVAWLMVEYDLDIDDVIRHYDVTGKECPKYYVEHEDAWENFKEDVQDYLEENIVKEKY